MKQKQYDLGSGWYPEDLPLSSFLDEFGITPESFDVRKLSVTFEFDRSGCWYPEDPPSILVTIEYCG